MEVGDRGLPAEGIGGGAEIAPGQFPLVIARDSLEGDPQLAQMVAAGDRMSTAPHLGDRGQQEGSQHGNDGDHDEQFDQGEGVSGLAPDAAGCPTPRASACPLVPFIQPMYTGIVTGIHMVFITVRRVQARFLQTNYKSLKSNDLDSFKQPSYLETMVQIRATRRSHR